MNREILIDCGIDYDGGVEKFMDEAELYERLLMEFPQDNTFDEAKECIEKGDYDGAAKAVHAMKSVTGTLSMNGLYRLCSRTVDFIRNGELQKADESFGETYSGYFKIVKGIEKAKEGGCN